MGRDGGGVWGSGGNVVPGGGCSEVEKLLMPDTKQSPYVEVNQDALVHWPLFLLANQVGYSPSPHPPFFPSFFYLC